MFTMDEKSYALCKKLVPKSYVLQAENAAVASRTTFHTLLEQRRIPEEGLSDCLIQEIINSLSKMDSNNFPGNCGAGEREGRLYSKLVADRHFHMSHGIGRSGELTSVQPKATGSSVMACLANSLALHALKLAGAVHVSDCFVVPMATGMTLCLTFLTLAKLRPEAKIIIWSRIDQKSCFKSMISAGLVPIIVENICKGDELQADVDEIERKIDTFGPENILCVHATTSCFAPRSPDNLPAISVICKTKDVPLVVNNAYGTQSTKCMHLIEQAARVGRMDAFVQSLDKNYMVPVGGSLLASYDAELLKKVSKLYPGRASGAQSLDLFITLLSMGVSGYKLLLVERKEAFEVLRSGLKSIAEHFGERVLETPNNQISIGKSTLLTNLAFAAHKGHATTCDASNFDGYSILKVVVPDVPQTIEGHDFLGYGSHCNKYPVPYLNLAAAIGTKKGEMETVLSRLDKVLKQLYSNSTLNAGDIAAPETDS